MDLVANLLIIRVILTTEDDRFLLVTLEFALLDELFFLCPNAFQQDGGRFVSGVLGDELAANGEIKDFGFGKRNQRKCFGFFCFNFVNFSDYVLKMFNNQLLLTHRRQGNRKNL